MSFCFGKGLLISAILIEKILKLERVIRGRGGHGILQWLQDIS